MTLFEQIIKTQNLYDAAKAADRGKRYRDSILRFNYNLERNILSLKKDLQNKTYTHGGYREFIVNDSKKRLIKAAPFRDRVVHHAVCNIIEPIIDKGFIYDSYACRKEKGVHSAILRLEYFIKSLSSCTPAKSSDSYFYGEGGHERPSFVETTEGAGERVADGVSSRSTHPGSSFNSNSGFRLGGQNDKTIYCLKCDIAKYFDNVDHEVLFGLLRKKIWDKDILWLLWEIIRSSSQARPQRLANSSCDGGLGIPIGNLTSQLFANIYLNELDHFVKRELKERYYIRYMDDFLILGTDKKHLAVQKERIREFLKDILKLELHPRKAEIFPIREPSASNGARSHF